MPGMEIEPMRTAFIFSALGVMLALSGAAVAGDDDGRRSYRSEQSEASRSDDERGERGERKHRSGEHRDGRDNDSDDGDDDRAGNRERDSDRRS